MVNQLPLRPNVCLLILNQDNLIFLGERLGEPGIWQLPQGGIESGCTAEEEALREASEELGVNQDLLSVLTSLTAINEYEFDSTPDYAHDRWRGQRQSFWILRYHGLDEQIKLDRFSPEFSSWRWSKLEDVEGLVEPKRYTGYHPALKELERWLLAVV